MAEAPDYSVPALEKGLDIIELLADTAGGLGQTEIAEATGRTVGQIFRVLGVLERRGYVVRDRQSGLYSFSMMSFDLAHRHPPLRGLVALATTPMRELADLVRQSCNLSIVDAGRVRVIAQVESPADFGYRVRVGAVFSLETAAGEVLGGASALTRGDPLQAGITDVVAPIVDARGTTRAALTVPYVATTFSGIPVDSVVSAAGETAAEISRLLQGEAR
ncbi:MAG: helix-turn-helix domain-containing protein [Rhodoglobus sp.]|nr:helix-turn-helix domain-containing protein [Rhodoglobus sp.]